MSEIKLHLCDCMKFMADKPDNYYDLGLVDPPYGIGEDGGKNREGPQSKKKGLVSRKYINKNWDSKKPDKKYFNELFRVSKNQIIWGGNYFVEYLNPSMGWIYWHKKGTDKSDFSDGELAYTSFKRALRWFKYDWVGFGMINSGQKKIHPTEKPIQLYKWLLKNYAKKGDKILDTHGGSGSIMIASYDMGFDLDWCELDIDYFESAKRRFENHKQQLRLF